MSLRTARSWHIRPSEFLPHVHVECDPGLMEGLTFLESRITQTGYPDWLTIGSHNMGHFKVVRQMDYAAEALEKAREGAKESVPGLQFAVERID